MNSKLVVKNGNGTEPKEMAWEAGTKTHSEIDLWFEALSQQGENMDISFGFLHPPQTHPQWTFFSHTECDGIGGFSKALSREGVVLKEMPQLKELTRPHFFRKVLAYTRFLANARVHRTPWKNFDIPEHNNKSCGIDTHYFETEQTETFKILAKKRNVTLNSLLLHSLNKAVSPQWTIQPVHNRWMIPINMRGGIKRSPTSNQTSYLGVDLDQRDSIWEVHKKVLAQKESLAHWGALWGLYMGQWLGEKGVRKTLSRYSKKGHSWTGTFSNLGSWNVKSDLICFFCPPVTQGHPIGAGALTHHGKLALTLQLHPGLTTRFSQVQESMQAWKQHLLTLMD